MEAAKERAREAAEGYRTGGSLPSSPAAPLSAEALEDFLGEPPAGAYVALHAYATPSEEADDALLALRLALRRGYRLATTAGYGPRFLHSTGQLHKGDGGRGLFVQLTSEPDEDLAIPAAPGEEEAGRSDAEAKAGAESGGDAGRSDAEDGAEEGGEGGDEAGRARSGGTAPARAAAGDAGAGPEAAGPRPLTFGALLAAQAVGDREALEEAGRRVIRFDVGVDAPAGIRALAEGLSADDEASAGDDGLPIDAGGG